MKVVCLPRFTGIHPTWLPEHGSGNEDGETEAQSPKHLCMAVPTAAPAKFPAPTLRKGQGTRGERTHGCTWHTGDMAMPGDQR